MKINIESDAHTIDKDHYLAPVCKFKIEVEGVIPAEALYFEYVMKHILAGTDIRKLHPYNEDYIEISKYCMKDNK